MAYKRSLLLAGLSALVLAFGWAGPTLVSAQTGTESVDIFNTAARRPARTFDVEHYIIRTRFDRQTRTVYGDVSVRVRALKAPIQSVELDAVDLKIESVVLGSDSTPLVWKATTNRLSISLPKPSDTSESVTVRIVYRAKPHRGLYFIPGIKGPPGVLQPAQIWTQGEAEENRYWFPCYDFPDDKATVEQYITTAANEIAISNGVLVNVANNADRTRTFHWSMDQPFSSYLVSLVVGDYAQIKDTYGDIAVEYNTYRGTEEVARRVFAKTPAMMRWFEKVLKIPYPYKRYAQTIVASFIFGGMENITATTHADTEILYADPTATDPGADDLISHELSHSWFGDLVTCKDWSELWLNEGLATFMEASFKESEGGREAYLAKLAQDQKELFAEDMPSKRHPLVNKNYSTGMELFDATTYKKGGWVIHMLRETVGDDVFWRALTAYLNEFKYANVTSADLQRVFEKVSGRNLDWFFKQWVYQAGYPELNVNYRYDLTDGKLTVEVEQKQKIDPKSPAAFRLPLEIEVTTAEGKKTVLADVTQRDQSFTFDLAANPTDVTVDPNSRLLKKVELRRAVLARPAVAAVFPY